MSKITEQEKLELETILQTMDIPIGRKTDYRWLIRNLAIRNGNNPQFERAYFLIRKALRSEL